MDTFKSKSLDFSSACNNVTIIAFLKWSHPLASLIPNIPDFSFYISYSTFSFALILFLNDLNSSSFPPPLTPWIISPIQFSLCADVTWICIFRLNLILKHMKHCTFPVDMSIGHFIGTSSSTHKTKFTTSLHCLFCFVSYFISSPWCFQLPRPDTHVSS